MPLSGRFRRFEDGGAWMVKVEGIEDDYTKGDLIEDVPVKKRDGTEQIMNVRVEFIDADKWGPFAVCEIVRDGNNVRRPPYRRQPRDEFPGKPMPRLKKKEGTTVPFAPGRREELVNANGIHGLALLVEDSMDFHIRHLGGTPCIPEAVRLHRTDLDPFCGAPCICNSRNLLTIPHSAGKVAPALCALDFLQKCDIDGALFWWHPPSLNGTGLPKAGGLSDELRRDWNNVFRKHRHGHQFDMNLDLGKAMHWWNTVMIPKLKELT